MANKKSRKWIGLKGGLILCGATAASVLLTSCRTAKQVVADNPTRIDRLITTYPELRAGRFAVIADFEDDAQLELFRVENISGDARHELIDSRRARGQRDNRRLFFRSALPPDALCINDDSANQWHLKRDWRDYDLLLFSVESPRNDARLELMISAGGPRDSRTATTAMRLSQGGNPIRLDLAELKERIPLDDIRELRFSVLEPNGPVELAFDDLLLTADREVVAGAPDAPTGSLFVERVAQRWIVAVTGRFELTFAHGQIVAWYNLVHDPQRLRNLVQGTTLGPALLWPVDETQATPSNQSADHERRVSVSTHLIEANVVRTVIETHWNFIRPDARGAEAPASYRCRYSIFSTGQVFVAVSHKSSAAANGSRATTGPSLAVNVAEAEIARADILIGPGQSAHSADSSSSVPPYALIKLPDAHTALLLVPHGPDQPLLFPERHGGEFATASVVITPPRTAKDDDHRWFLMHMVHGADLLSSIPDVLARRYVHPPLLDLQLGSIAPGEDGGRLDGSGFDPETGTYLLYPVEDMVRFSLPTEKVNVPFHPAFVIRNSRDREGWVYVNDRLLQPVARDVNGDLLFHVSPSTARKTIVELLLRNRAGS